jgi:hypothetical protein
MPPSFYKPLLEMEKEVAALLIRTTNLHAHIKAINSPAHAPLLKATQKVCDKTDELFDEIRHARIQEKGIRDEMKYAPRAFKEPTDHKDI